MRRNVLPVLPLALLIACSEYEVKPTGEHNGGDSGAAGTAESTCATWASTMPLGASSTPAGSSP